VGEAFPSPPNPLSLPRERGSKGVPPIRAPGEESGVSGRLV